MSNEELAARIKAGVDVAENMLLLWEQTKDFIRCMARRYQGYAELEDLEQEGYLALYDAVDGYRREAGCKFLSYASFWIRQGMRRYIENCCQAVRIPSHEQQKIYRYRKLENAFRVCHGRGPTRREAAWNLGLEEGQVTDLEAALAMSRVGSLDGMLQEGEDGDTLGDMVPGSADVEVEATERVDQGLLRETVWDMVDRLPGRQPEVIRMRYQGGMTLKEIGEVYGASIDAVRQSEKAGLRALRWSDGGRLRAFLPEAEEAQAYRHCGAREFGTTWTSSTERVAMRL